jgi:hypothetical protein
MLLCANRHYYLWVLNCCPRAPLIVTETNSKEEVGLLRNQDLSLVGHHCFQLLCLMANERFGDTQYCYSVVALTFYLIFPLTSLIKWAENSV